MSTPDEIRHQVEREIVSALKDDDWRGLLFMDPPLFDLIVGKILASDYPHYTPMPASCQHEPFEHVLVSQDGDGVRYACPVVFLFDSQTQIRHDKILTASSPYLHAALMSAGYQPPASAPSYAVMGCRHCGALFVGPEQPAREIKDDGGDPYR